MGLQRARLQWLLSSLLLMILGCSVYLWLRSSNLLLFGLLGDKEVLLSMIPFRSVTLGYSATLPDWFLYSLPDGLWLASYLCLIAFLWRGTIKLDNALWYVIVPILAIASEFAQLSGHLPGTFDPLDVACYLFSTLIPMAFLNISKHKPSFYATNN